MNLEAVEQNAAGALGPNRRLLPTARGSSYAPGPGLELLASGLRAWVEPKFCWGRLEVGVTLMVEVLVLYAPGPGGPSGASLLAKVATWYGMQVQK
jgi:hypothetical protein